MTSASIIRMVESDIERPTYGPEPANHAVEGTPIEHLHEYHSADGRTCGVWECSPGRMREPQEVDEFCTILAGKVGLIADGGEEELFVAGDSFFLPKGSTLTWVVYETVRKFYMTAE